MKPTKLHIYLLLTIFNWISVTADPQFENEIVLESKTRHKRLAGGQKSVAGHYPFHVAIYEGPDNFVCSGSIIKPKWVLTAAHCVKGGDHTSFRIVAGTNRIGQNPSGIISSVEEIHYHRRFNGKSVRFDIGLLRSKLYLSHYFRTNLFNVQPIPITQKSPYSYDYAYLSGWGGTPNKTLVNEMHFAKLKIFPAELCEQLFDDFNDYSFCAGNVKPHAVACKGDSGAPLVSYGSLIGIVSGGIGCGSKYYASLYTNIYALREWIEEKTKNDWDWKMGLNPRKPSVKIF